MALEHTPIRHSSHKLVSPRTPQQVPLFSRRLVSPPLAADTAVSSSASGTEEAAELAAAARRFEQADRERAEFKQKWKESQLQLLHSENEIAQLQLKLLLQQQQQQQQQQSSSRVDQVQHQHLLHKPSSPFSSTVQLQMLQQPPSPGTGWLGPPLAMRRGQSASRWVTSTQRPQESGTDSSGDLHPRLGSRTSPKSGTGGPSPTGSNQSMTGIAAPAL